jgi:hypothetical protein
MYRNNRKQWKLFWNKVKKIPIKREKVYLKTAKNKKNKIISGWKDAGGLLWAWSHA